MPFLWSFLRCNPRYDPWLIDLHRYEADLLRSKARGGTLWPPPTTPGREEGNWSLAESQAMEANRAEAMRLYEWVAQLRIIDPRAVGRRRAAKMHAGAARRAR